MVTALPCLVMLTITSWAMVENEKMFIRNQDWLLVVIGAVIFLLAAWMTVEAVIVFFKGPKADPTPQE